jgi:hypothetical protein
MNMEEFNQLTEVEKLAHILELTKNVSAGIRAEVFKQLYGNDTPDQSDQGDLELEISNNGQIVRVDFGKPVRWIGLPNAHAVQFAIMLMEHAGAKLERANPNNDDTQA